MSSFHDFETFEDFFAKIMKSVQGFDEIEKEVKSSKLKGKWNAKLIDEPDIKGYIIRGRFWSDQPLKPFNPFEPLDPRERRPIPQRPILVPKDALNEVREPLTDVFEEENVVKIYAELPGEEKEDIQLNITDGRVEIKAKNFYTMINVPSNIDIEKSSSKYNNGVLTITVPKKEQIFEKTAQKISIE